MNVKVLRLKSGEDIIGDILTDDNNFTTILDPMCFIIDNSKEHAKLLLDHWLPFQAIKHNQFTFETTEILGVMEPTEDFIEYYMNAVDKLYSVLHAQESVNKMSDLEIIESIIAMQEKDKEIIH